MKTLERILLKIFKFFAKFIFIIYALVTLNFVTSNYVMQFKVHDETAELDFYSEVNKKYITNGIYFIPVVVNSYYTYTPCLNEKDINPYCVNFYSKYPSTDRVEVILNKVSIYLLCGDKTYTIDERYINEEIPYHNSESVREFCFSEYPMLDFEVDLDKIGVKRKNVTGITATASITVTNNGITETKDVECIHDRIEDDSSSNLFGWLLYG